MTPLLIEERHSIHIDSNNNEVDRPLREGKDTRDVPTIPTTDRAANRGVIATVIVDHVPPPPRDAILSPARTHHDRGHVTRVDPIDVVPLPVHPTIREVDVLINEILRNDHPIVIINVGGYPPPRDDTIGMLISISRREANVTSPPLLHEENGMRHEIDCRRANVPYPGEAVVVVVVAIIIIINQQQ